MEVRISEITNSCGNDIADGGVIVAVIRHQKKNTRLKRDCSLDKATCVGRNNSKLKPNPKEKMPNYERLH